ncbi:unnamed protein product [Rotaria magnacalcarata]|uniref:Uncharacterized protein n=2 Tax=Rotaria magnacalcarata TaxID=392030 RepID=A0A814WKT2_9BILA|nr:unnamed protein product [Rotaria magnacalcarata]CAF1617121.1 unnamed protein product [Rotaria magnacalcarata]CAF2028336.1 unnamed protein product [Rotaria magnacalcarata]
MSKTESAQEHSYIWCPLCSAFQQHVAGVLISCIMVLITMIVCLWRREECLEEKCPNNALFLFGIVLSSVYLLLMIIMFYYDIVRPYRSAATINTDEPDRRNVSWYYRRWYRLLVDKYKHQFQVDHHQNHCFQRADIV